MLERLDATPVISSSVNCASVDRTSPISDLTRSTKVVSVPLYEKVTRSPHQNKYPNASMVHVVLVVPDVVTFARSVCPVVHIVDSAAPEPVNAVASMI